MWKPVLGDEAFDIGHVGGRAAGVGRCRRRGLAGRRQWRDFYTEGVMGWAEKKPDNDHNGEKRDCTGQHPPGSAPACKPPQSIKRCRLWRCRQIVAHGLIERLHDPSSTASDTANAAPRAWRAAHTVDATVPLVTPIASPISLSLRSAT